MSSYDGLLEKGLPPAINVHEEVQFLHSNSINDIMKRHYFWQPARLVTANCINFTATSEKAAARQETNSLQN